MNRARQVVLVAVALLVAAFVVTWATIPSNRRDAVQPPASFFMSGLTDRVCGFSALAVATVSPPWQNAGAVPCKRVRSVDIEALKRRVEIIYGGAAAVIVLLGLAFGAARRR